MGTTTGDWINSSSSYKMYLSDYDYLYTDNYIIHNSVTGCTYSGHGEVSKAFDGDSSTYMYIGDEEFYAVINFPSPITVNKLVATGYRNDSTQHRLQIYGSNNGTTWTSVWSDLLLPEDVGAEVKVLSSSVSYSYFKVSNSISTSSYDSIWLHSLEFYANNSSPSTIVWESQTSEGVIQDACIQANQTLGTGTITYYVSRDGGTTFTECPIDTLTDISAQPEGTSVVLKAVITGDAKLYGVAWGGLV